MASPVVLGETASSAALTELANSAASIGEDVVRALSLAVQMSAAVPHPGSGETLGRWQTLATLGAADLTVARVVEPHLDALSILDEAELAGIKVDLDAIGADAASSWGVFAAEGPGVKLTASVTAEGWILDGTKPWCSLADRLSHALVTAHTPEGRGLFAISLQKDVDVPSGTWVARGLTNVTSGPITVRQVKAVPVGPAQWYLERPGFAWGGIGVAAVWLGGAVALARALFAHAAAKPADQLRGMQLGAVDTALAGATSVLVGSAAAIDRGDLAGPAAALLAARVRGVVAEAAELTVIKVGHALGPAPLALDAEHARRVADLQLYLRQHHAERDQAALGTQLTSAGELPW